MSRPSHSSPELDDCGRVKKASATGRSTGLRRGAPAHDSHVLSRDRKALVLAELLPQLLLRLHQYLLARGRQIFAGAIDVEGEHGERGAEWIGLAAIASLRRAFQRGGNPPGILRSKDTALKR